MPPTPAPEIDAIAVHSPQASAARANKPPSAHAPQPRPTVEHQQAFATIPIVPNQPAASFNPASMRSRSPPLLRARSCHATSQNPQDSKIHAARFDRFKFLFHSFAAATFATQSARSRHAAVILTSSARASRVGGISRPSALAVLRLITRSYFTGACTGRSAGLAPLRMRSTYPAACRYWSIRSGPYDARPPSMAK
jgi:hypothetical protein